jgi:hypothetical protein
MKDISRRANFSMEQLPKKIKKGRLSNILKGI